MTKRTASKKADSPAAYNDVRYVLDIAVKTPGITYEFATSGKAVNFRQRCNRYRNLMRQMSAELLADTPGARAQTAYDCIVIRQIDAETGQPSRKGTVLLFDHERPEGILRAPDGTEIKPDLSLFSPLAIVEPEAEE